MEPQKILIFGLGFIFLAGITLFVSFKLQTVIASKKKQEYCEHIIFFVPDYCLNFCLQNVQSKLHRGFEQLASMLKTSQDACAEKIKSISVGG